MRWGTFLTWAIKIRLIQTKFQDWRDFKLDANGVLSATKAFDFERKNEYTLTVEVCDENSSQLIDRCAKVRFQVLVSELM
jgi:hypothetical protein